MESQSPVRAASDSLLSATQPDAFPAEVGDPAAVYAQRFSIYESAHLRIGQKRDGLRDVVHRSETAHGDAVGDVLVGIAGVALIGRVHGGLYPTGAHRVRA